MNKNQISRIGGIFFFIGLILVLISWQLTYPIHMSESNVLSINQFFPTIWPGMILSLIGLFLAGYYSERKSVKVLCISIFPIILHSYAFFFSFIPTSDSGSVKAMFEIFNHTGINSIAEPYFQYPIYFTINQITNQTLGIDVYGLAAIYFLIFGVLMSLYLYLYLLKITKNDTYQIAYFGVFIFFTGVYTFLNYQWVPQTLALIFFLLLLILFDIDRIGFKILSVFIFIVLVFTHLFIPVIFLMFAGLYSIKNKELRNRFILMSCIYISVLIYYRTFYLSILLDTFRETIYGFGQEYSISFSRSLMEPKGLTSQIISAFNRFRIPFTWLVVTLGFFIMFIKKKVNLQAIFMTITGVFYFLIGLFYQILGTRALQVLFIPLALGFEFYVSKWKKLAFIFIVLILVLSAFGPIREVYDEYQFQLDQDANASSFLSNTLTTGGEKIMVMSGINSGYFLKKFNYLNMNKNVTKYIQIYEPRNLEFYNIYNRSLRENEYILYNPNLDKEAISFGVEIQEIDILKENILNNNKIYTCDRTYVLAGLKNNIK